MYLAIRTDSNTTELTLLAKDETIIERVEWESGRTLSDHLLTKILELLAAHNLQPQDLQGIIVFTGPGSFTGLRIGATVANTMAYVKGIPIVGLNGDGWIERGLHRLAQMRTISRLFLNMVQ